MACVIDSDVFNTTTDDLIVQLHAWLHTGF